MHPEHLLGVHGQEDWPVSTTKTPKIISLDVKCERNSMKVFIAFDKPFYGIIFSKGHYSNPACVHLKPGQGSSNANFEIGIHHCGTAGNTENGYYGYGSESGSGTYFENVIVIQYDPQVQEIWDQARKLRCTWHDQYEKRVTFRPFPVDMLEIIRADFAGDNVGCWMQIQVGRGPWASEVSGLVKIGQAMTMVLAIKDYDSKFDMLVRNCMAHDGKHAPIQLVDRYGCVTRPKLMSRFTKIKNFGASASILSYAHFQAFKFPDSMEVHFQCTIQICRHRCPEQCDKQAGSYSELYGPAYVGSREKRAADPKQEVGLNKVIRVVSTGDLTFPVAESANSTNTSTLVFPARNDGIMCMATISFMIALVVLLLCLAMSCLFSAFLWIKLRSFSQVNRKLQKTNKPLTFKKSTTHGSHVYS